MASLGDLIIKLGVNAQEFDKGLGNSMRKLNQFGKNTKKIGANLTRNLTLPLAAVGAGSFKLAADFEASMAKVKAVSGATASEFAALEKNALDLGSSTKFTATEVSGLQLEFSKLGFSAAEITKVTGATLALAQATGSDLATSAEVAGATLRGFGLDASETGRVTDVMAASFSSSALDMSSFQDSMKFVAPVAKAAGVSLEETTAMLAALANNGIKGSQAGTALRRIISDLGSTGGNVANAIKRLANEGLNLADAKDEVGRSAQSALLVLSENIGVTDELTTSFGNATGTASEMAGIMDSTAEGSLAKMRSALEGAAIVIGKSLAPTITQLANFISNIATKFSNLSESTQGTIIKVGALVGAIGPFLLIVPTLVSAIGSIRLALSAMMGPMGLVVAGITALAASFIDFGGDVDTANDSLLNIQKTAGGSVIPLEQMDSNMLRKELEELTKDLSQFANSAEEIEDLKFLSDLTADQTGFNSALERGKSRIEELLQDLTDLKAAYKNNSITLKEYNKLSNEANRDIDVYQNIVKTATVALDKFKQQQAITNQTISTGEETYESAARGINMVATESIQAVPIINAVDESVKTLGTSFTSVADLFVDTRTEFEKMQEGLSNGMLLLQDTALQMGNSLGFAFGQMIKGSEDAGKALKESVLGIIDAALASSTALIIEAMINTGKFTGPAAPIVIPALVATGIGLVRGLFSAISVPAMAEGGIVSGNTLVQVGEYAGASTNPEVIAPLDKLKSMLGGAGGGQVQVHGVIRGRDIFLTNEVAARELGNIRAF